MKFKSLILLVSGLVMSDNLAAKVELVWGIDEVLAHQIRIAREVKKEIEEKSHGEISINIELYGNEVLKASQKERFDIHQTIIGNFSNRVPELKIWEIPYLFKNSSHVEAYMASSRGKSILAKLEDDKWLPINYSYAGGFLHLYTKSKISSFKDLQNSRCGFAPSFGFYKEFIKPQGINMVKDGEKEDCFEVLSSEVEAIYGRSDASSFVLNLSQHRIVTRATYISKEKLINLGKWEKDLVKLIYKKLNKERTLVYEASDLALKLIKNRGLKVNTKSFRESSLASKEYKDMISRLSPKQKAEFDFVKSLGQKRNISSITH